MTPTKTPNFALERLAAGDPLSSDGYIFQDEDRQTIDLLLLLGAVTHRHDGHAALANPTLAPVVSSASSGGSIPAATPIFVTYTLLDTDGGETAPVAAVALTTAPGYTDPFDVPTAVVDYLAGTLLADNYSYGVTVTDGLGGETAISPAALVTVNPGNAHAEVAISGLSALTADSSGGALGAGWRLWRSQGGGVWYLIGTGVAATDTFLDNGVAGDCTVQPPSSGTTVGANTLSVTVPGGQPASTASFNIYASFDGGFVSPALLGNFPLGDLDVAQVFTALAAQSGSPPAVSRAKSGANPIDALTQLINLIKVPMTTSPNSPVAADYTLQLSDLGTVLEYNSNANHTLTVPPNASVNFPVGATIEVFVLAAGQITFVAGGGVTILAPGGRLHSGEQYGTIGLRQRATDVWVLSGDLV